MNKKTIYLSGAIEGLTFEESNKWRVAFAEKLELFDTPYTTFNPNSHFTLEDINSNKADILEVMEYDLHRLRHSDLVVVNFGNPRSLGTMAEIAIAYEHRIPVIGFTKGNRNLHDWQTIMCQKILPNMNSALSYILEHFNY